MSTIFSTDMKRCRAAMHIRSSKYGSTPRHWPVPPWSPRCMWMSATSRSSAGIATSSSPSAYGDFTVASVGLRRITSEPRPTRVGRNGTRHAAACRPRRNMPSSSSVVCTAPDWPRVAEVRLERDRVERHERVHDPAHLAGPAEQPDFGAAVGDDREVAHRRAERARARAPSACAAIPTRRCRRSCRPVSRRRHRRS